MIQGGGTKRRLFRACGLALAPVLLLAASAAAQEPEEVDTTAVGVWDFGATVGVNFSQSAYSSNWAGGDKGSMVWVLGSDLSAERQFSPVFHLSNLLQIAYGQTTRQVDDPEDPDRRIWDKPEKTTDLIQFESVGRFDVQTYVEPFLSFRLDTQFQDESDPAGTILFNPVRLKETAGIARVLQKDEDSELITRLGFGFRQTFGRAFVETTGTVKESFQTNDGGFEWQTSAVRPLLDERVLYKGKLLVFLPVFYSKSDALEEFDAIAMSAQPGREPIADFWMVPDVNFQNTFTAQITEVISVNLYAQAIYDKFDSATNVDTSLPPAVLIREVDRGIRKAVQFKQTLALGVSYALF